MLLLIFGVTGDRLRRVITVAFMVCVPSDSGTEEFYDDTYKI